MKCFYCSYLALLHFILRHSLHTCIGFKIILRLPQILTLQNWTFRFFGIFIDAMIFLFFKPNLGLFLKILIIKYNIKNYIYYFTVPALLSVFSGDLNADLLGIANLSQAEGMNSGVSPSSSLKELTSLPSY